jgi:hypothetical protein
VLEAVDPTVSFDERPGLTLSVGLRFQQLRGFELYGLSRRTRQYQRHRNQHSPHVLFFSFLKICIPKKA